MSIKHMIEDRGLALADVARVLRISRQAMSQVAKAGTPRATTARNIASAISQLCPERPVTTDDVLACGKAHP